MKDTGELGMNAGICPWTFLPLPKRTLLAAEKDEYQVLRGSELGHVFSASGLLETVLRAIIFRGGLLWLRL